jgi:hypothetical protein
MTRWRPDVPTLDDEFLVTLLHDVGDSFTIPPAGPHAILRRVHRDDDERAAPPRPRRSRRRS